MLNTLCFVDSCMNGFDGSIMSGINAIPAYLDHFGLSNTSPSTGLVFAMYSAGSLVSVPFAGPISDILGRRYGMLIGSLFIMVGTVVVVTAPHSKLFLIKCLFVITLTHHSGPVHRRKVPPWFRSQHCGFCCPSLCSRDVTTTIQRKNDWNG